MIDSWETNKKVGKKKIVSIAILKIANLKIHE